MTFATREIENWRGYSRECVFVKRTDLKECSFEGTCDMGIDVCVDHAYNIPDSVEVVVYTETDMYNGSQSDYDRSDDVTYLKKAVRYLDGQEELIEECTDPLDESEVTRIGDIFSKYYDDREWCLLRPSLFGEREA